MSNEGTMKLAGDTYVSGEKLADEYNKYIQDEGEEMMSPYVLDALLEDAVENQTVYSVKGVKAYTDKMLEWDKKDKIAKRLKKAIKHIHTDSTGENTAAEKEEDKELRVKAPKKKERVSPVEKIRKLVKQIEEREERNIRLNKRDRETIRKELKKLDKVGKMSLSDLIYFPEE